MKTNMVQKLVGTFLAMTGYRFSKYHRHNETFLYRYLGTTAANIYADNVILARYKQIMGSI